MSIGSWSPNTDKDEANYQLEPALLQDFIRVGRDQQCAGLEQLLSQDQQQVHSPLMQLPREAWLAATDSYDKDDIIALIRFLTLAEMKYSGWQAGAESPVIWLTKALRQRGEKPSRELLLWIRANTDNKFLPNGAL